MKVIQVLTLIVSLAILGFVFLNSQGGVGGYTADISFSGDATHATSTIGSDTSATGTILSANSDRNFAKVCNTGLARVDVCLHSTACVFGQGIALQGIDAQTTASTTPSVCFEINRNNLYTGAIIGVVNATTSTSNIDNTIQTIEK